MTSSDSIRLVSVVLPTYNEAGNIVSLAEAIHAAVKQPHEIIVVDDNSPDGTSQLVRDRMAKGDFPELKVETRMTDRGLTKSIRHGIETAKGDVVVWMDCDFSMPPEKIPELLQKIAEGADIAVGSRFVPGGKYKESDRLIGGEESGLAILLSRLINWFLRVSLSPRFHDYTSGFVAVRSEVFQKIRLTGDYGEYFIDFIYRAILLKYTITEIPYVCMPRRAGESKTGASLKHLWKFGMNYLAVVWRMQRIRLKKAFGGDITG